MLSMIVVALQQILALLTSVDQPSEDAQCVGYNLLCLARLLLLPLGYRCSLVYKIVSLIMLYFMLPDVKRLTAIQLLISSRNKYDPTTGER